MSDVFTILMLTWLKSFRCETVTLNNMYMHLKCPRVITQTMPILYFTEKLSKLTKTTNLLTVSKRPPCTNNLSVDVQSQKNVQAQIPYTSGPTLWYNKQQNLWYISFAALKGSEWGGGVRNISYEATNSHLSFWFSKIIYLKKIFWHSFWMLQVRRWFT